MFDNKMWVVGGYDGLSTDDAWWSANGSDWTKLEKSMPHWPRRRGHGLVVFDNKVWILGGTSGSHKKDIWFYE